MLDLHCHLLPEMDDGSDGVQTTKKILELLAEQGVTQVVASSHFYATEDRPEEFLRRRAQSLASVAGIADAPRIIPGAEVAYFDGMSNCQALQDLTIENTNLILVEMPFAEWTERMVGELVKLKSYLGLQPVLAHIERYRDRRQLPKFLGQLVSEGIAMQCNTASVLQADTRRWVIGMIKKGNVHFLGTDAHNLTTRAPAYGEAVAFLQKKLPPDLVAELTAEL